METNSTDRAIVWYQAELANIRYFFREKRTMSEWQDWLWRKMPKLKAVTVKVPPYAPRIGRWGATQTSDKAVLYTDLLTLLVSKGDVLRTRTRHQTTYVVKPVDIVAKPSYTADANF